MWQGNVQIWVCWTGPATAAGWRQTLISENSDPIKLKQSKHQGDRDTLHEEDCVPQVRQTMNQADLVFFH